MNEGCGAGHWPALVKHCESTHPNIEFFVCTVCFAVTCGQPNRDLVKQKKKKKKKLIFSFYFFQFNVIFFSSIVKLMKLNVVVFHGEH